MFAENNYNGKVPNISLTDEDYNLIALVNRELSGYISVLEKGKLREGNPNDGKYKFQLRIYSR